MSSTSPTQFRAVSPLLPAALAGESQGGGYAVVAILTAFCWDWLLSVADDFRIARKCGFRLSIVAYFMSRAGILGMCILATILPTASHIAHCETLFRLGEISAIVGTTATSFLFLLSVRAVFENSKAVTAFFGSFWLIGMGTSILRQFASRDAEYGTTQRCVVSEVKQWSAVFLWVKAAYDTLIFLAISFRISSQSIPDRAPRISITSFLRGNGLSQIKRDLLHGGQLYYFVTIGMTLFGCIMTVVPMQPIFRTIFVGPTLALENSMACRVFRAVVLDSARGAPRAPPSLLLTTVIPPEGEEGEEGWHSAPDAEICDQA